MLWCYFLLHLFSVPWIRSGTLALLDLPMPLFSITVTCFYGEILSKRVFWTEKGLCPRGNFVKSLNLSMFLLSGGVFVISFTISVFLITSFCSTENCRNFAILFLYSMSALVSLPCTTWSINFTVLFYAHGDFFCIFWTHLPSNSCKYFGTFHSLNHSFCILQLAL